MEKVLQPPQGDAIQRCCKVAGCTAILADETGYSMKHKVCKYHRDASSIEVDGAAFRWCQHCTKLEPLYMFEGPKRRCDAKLDELGKKRKAKSNRARGSDTDTEVDEHAPYQACKQRAPQPRRTARKDQVPSTSPTASPQHGADQDAGVAAPDMPPAFQTDGGIPGNDMDVPMPMHAKARWPRAPRTRRTQAVQPELPLPFLPGVQDPNLMMNINAALANFLELPLPGNLGLGGPNHGPNHVGALGEFPGPMDYHNGNAGLVMPAGMPLPPGFGPAMRMAPGPDAPPTCADAPVNFGAFIPPTFNAPPPFNALHYDNTLPQPPPQQVDMGATDSISAPGDLYGLWRASAGGASAGGAPLRGASVGGASLEKILFGGASFGGAAIEPPLGNGTNAALGQGSGGQMNGGLMSDNLNNDSTLNTPADSDEDVLCPMRIKPQGADEWRMANDVHYEFDADRY